MMRSCWNRLLGSVILLALAHGALGASRQAHAQDTADRAAETAKRTERLEEMKELVSSFKVVAISDEGQETPAASSDEPRHSWTDPTRDFHGGALWVWRASGRPVAVLGLELYASWSLEFAAVCSGRVKAENSDVRRRLAKVQSSFTRFPMQ